MTCIPLGVFHNSMLLKQFPNSFVTQSANPFQMKQCKFSSRNCISHARKNLALFRRHIFKLHRNWLSTLEQKFARLHLPSSLKAPDTVSHFGTRLFFCCQDKTISSSRQKRKKSRTHFTKKKKRAKTLTSHFLSTRLAISRSSRGNKYYKLPDVRAFRRSGEETFFPALSSGNQQNSLFAALQRVFSAKTVAAKNSTVVKTTISHMLLLLAAFLESFTKEQQLGISTPPSTPLPPIILTFCESLIEFLI